MGSSLHQADHSDSSLAVHRHTHTHAHKTKPGLIVKRQPSPRRHRGHPPPFTPSVYIHRRTDRHRLRWYASKRTQHSPPAAMQESADPQTGRHNTTQLDTTQFNTIQYSTTQHNTRGCKPERTTTTTTLHTSLNHSHALAHPFLLSCIPCPQPPVPPPPQFHSSRLVHVVSRHRPSRIHHELMHAVIIVGIRDSVMRQSRELQTTHRVPACDDDKTEEV